MSRPACKAILSEAVLTGGEALGMSVYDTCLEGSTSLLVKILQGFVIIRTLPSICGAHRFHSFLPLFLLSLLLKQRDLQPEQFVAVRIDKNRNPPLAVDANVSASH